MKTNLQDTYDILGSCKTEAWADADHYQEETHVSIPSVQAVEDAMNWIGENKK